MGQGKATYTMRCSYVKAILCLPLLYALHTQAADISIVGLFSGRAVVVIDSSKPRTLSTGQTSAEDVKLISADMKRDNQSLTLTRRY